MDGASPSKSRRPWPTTLLWTASLALGAGCSTYIGTTSQSFLRQVRNNPDPNIRYIAYSKLGKLDLYDSPQSKAEAVETLIAKYREGREPLAIRAIIIRALGELGDPRARGTVLKAVNDVDNPVIRVEACRALGKVGRAEDATILARIMTVDALEDCRIAAIEGMGALKANDPRINQVLLDGMDHDDPAIRLASLNALRQITGKDLGVDPARWRKEFDPTVASASAPTKEAARARDDSAKKTAKRQDDTAGDAKRQ